MRTGRFILGILPDRDEVAHHALHAAGAAGELADVRGSPIELDLGQRSSRPDAVIGAQGQGEAGRGAGIVHLAQIQGKNRMDALVLEADGAITKWRDTMGATDPKKATPGTIRHDLGTNIGNNCTHGSDAQDTAAFEIGYFFSGLELI